MAGVEAERLDLSPKTLDGVDETFSGGSGWENDSTRVDGGVQDESSAKLRLFPMTSCEAEEGHALPWLLLRSCSLALDSLLAGRPRPS